MDIKTFFTENSGDIIFITAIIVGAIILTRILRWTLNRYIQRSATKLNSDPTKFKFLKNSISVLIFLVATILIIYRIPGGQTLAVSLFASAGIFAAVAGFASQAAFSNIVSGTFIVIFKPFRVGDIIRIGTGTMGTVTDITLRHTVIRDFENRRIIIPNSVISEQTVVNSTIEDEKICRHIEFAISYESNIKLARKIIQEEATKSPLCLDARLPEDIATGEPVVQVRVISLGDYSVNLRAYVWSRNSADSWELFTQLNETIKERFAEVGIEIPYPHRTLVFKNNQISAIDQIPKL